MKNLILFALIFSLNLISQEFEIDLSGSMEETVLGAPLYIRVEVRNVSGKGQKIAGAFNYRYILKGIKGGEAQLWNGMEVSYIPCEKVKINYISADWKEVKVEDISQFYIRRKGEIAKDKIKQAGEYRIEVIASPRCNKGVDKEGLLDYNVWHGQLKKEIVIEIKEPEGVDREAYEYFKGKIYSALTFNEWREKLLEKFPTSTYAGWMVYNISNINYIEKLDIESQYKYSRRTKEDIKKNYKGDYDEREIERVWKEMEKEKGEARKRINFLEEFIKERPNFALREYIEFEIGFWSFYVGDYKKAKEKIDGIMKGSKNSLLIEKSRKIEEIIKREGLIK